jgi:hypothetical protein
VREQALVRVGEIEAAQLGGTFQPVPQGVRVHVPVTSARDGTTEPTAARTEVDGLAMGDVTDLTNFLGAVIDRRAFDRLAGVQRAAAADRR